MTNLSNSAQRSEALTAMCLWEELDSRTREDARPNWPALNRYRDNAGAWELRTECLDLAPLAEAVWALLEEGSGLAPIQISYRVAGEWTVRWDTVRRTHAESAGLERFDWEFIPAFLTAVGIGEEWQGRVANVLTPVEIVMILRATKWCRQWATWMAPPAT